MMLLTALCVYTAIFASYITTSIPSLLLALFLSLLAVHHLRLEWKQGLVLFVITGYFISGCLLASNVLVFLKDFRFFFGFLIYYLFLVLYKIDRVLDVKLFRFICYSIVLEAVLINTFIDPSWMPNFHLSPSGSTGEYTHLLGWYQRPLSFAGNTSMSSTVLIVLYLVIDVVHPGHLSRKDAFFLFISICLLSSGTGIFLYLIVMVVRICNQGGNIFAAKLVELSCALLVLGDIYGFQRLSIEYCGQILTIKVAEVVNAITHNYHSPLLLFFGHEMIAYTPSTSSDFGWLTFMTESGILGIVVFFLSMILLSRGSILKLFKLPMFILFIGSLHYPGLFSQGGQLLFAFMLTKDGFLDHNEGHPMRLQPSILEPYG